MDRDQPARVRGGPRGRRGRASLVWVAALAALLCGGLGAAPSRAAALEADLVAEEVKRHAEAGDALYDQGRYEEAIVEYRACYALRPHPNALYNIAQAEERLLDYAAAVSWFQRYLDEAPREAPQRRIVEARLRVLRSLPARVSITSQPERVHVALRPAEGGATVEGDTPAELKVPAGSYELTLTADGYAPLSRRLELAIGQPYLLQLALSRQSAPVTIFTQPRGARVFIDDRLVGETPFAGVVDVGSHRLLLEHKDYPWLQRPLEVSSQSPVRLELKLSRPIRSGRTELVIGSMIYGGAAAPLLVAAVGSRSNFLSTDAGVATLVLSSVAGLGAGFLGSFLTTQSGIKVGKSSLLIGGASYGTGFGAALGLALQLEAPYLYGLSLLGGAVGIAATAIVSQLRDVSPGTAALVNSGALWGAATGALFAQALFIRPSTQELGISIVSGLALGLTAGALVGWKVDRTRGQVFLIDVGGFIGSGLGFALGAAVGASSNGDILQDGARYALGGTVLGILAAAALSRTRAAGLPPSEAILFRRETGQGGRWGVGLPRLSLETALLPEGRALRVMATLASGSL